MKYLLSLLFIFLPSQFIYSANEPIPTGETPASLACVYGLTPQVPGCPINRTRAIPQTGSGAIAVVDGQDDPNAFAELTIFSSQFSGLRVLSQCNTNNTNQPCFQQYYVSYPFDPANPCVIANNNAATYNIGPTTDIEPALDIEWAHAMAPNASIYMVETQGWLLNTTNQSDPNITAFLQGLQCAAYLLQTYNGGGIISYSNSTPEFPGEMAYDAYFQRPGITYIASSGDYSAPARYPAVSSYMIGAGGTSIRRDAAGNYIDQIAWHDSNPGDNGKSGGSGGPSLYVPRPSFQNNIQKIVGNKRGTPDISFVAENVDVFCCQLPSNNKCCGVTGKPACQTLNACASNQGAWVVTGGTSLASPALAGIINSAHSGATSSAQELAMIYNGALKNYHTYWTDIIFGNNGYSALAGYDFATGLGVPHDYSGK